MIRNLIKIVLIVSLFTLPTSCDEMTKPIIIGDAVNLGAVDITLTYNESLFVITDVGSGSFDVTAVNLEHNNSDNDSWVRIGAFQTDSPGLDGQVNLCSIALAGNLTDLGSLSMTVNTLKDASPQCGQINSTVDGFTVTALAPSPLSSPLPPSPTPPKSTSSGRGGGGGVSYAPTPAPPPAMAPVAETPVEVEVAEEVPAPESIEPPEPIMEPRTEPLSRPPPIFPPATGISVVAVVATFGIVMVTRTTKEHKNATIATTGIVIVSVAAIIGMMLI